MFLDQLRFLGVSKSTLNLNIILYKEVIYSNQNVCINTKKLSDANFKSLILFVPGGIGTRKLIYNKKLIAELTRLVNNAKYILTVCTGSSLFSQTNLLNSKKATSNKKALKWTKSIAPDVN